MNCLIPFTKEIKFKTNIAEILSISLEHEYTINDNELLGNFIITGEYKSHEVSVNRESFDYVLPFSVNLTNPIDTDTVDFAIEDFTYEIIDNNTLKVDIEYSIKAQEMERKEEIFEEVSEKEEEKAEDLMEDVILNDNLNTDDTIEDETIEEKEDEERIVAVPASQENEEEIAKETVTEEEKNVVMNAITEEENDFVTYHIHIMKENETIESICTKYNVSNNVLENYNDLKNITFGEKIIIPEVDE